MCRSDLTSGDRVGHRRAYGQGSGMIRITISPREWGLGEWGDRRRTARPSPQGCTRAAQPQRWVFDDTAPTLASEEKIAEHRADGENLLELSDHGFIGVCSRVRPVFVNVDGLRLMDEHISHATATDSALIKPGPLLMIRPAGGERPADPRHLAPGSGEA